MSVFRRWLADILDGLSEFALTLENFLLWLCTLGQWIREVRSMGNFTQEDFAGLLGVDIRTVQRWEADQMAPRPRLLYQIQRIERMVKDKC